MRVAVLDVGSFSALTLVASADRRGRLRPLAERYQVVDLARSLSDSSSIDDTAWRAILRAQRTLEELVDEYRVDRGIVVTTAAMRSARNREMILHSWRGMASCPVVLLTARREALLGALGATAGLPRSRSGGGNKSEPTINCDIGGGSTELVAVGAAKLKVLTIPIGAANLTEIWRSDRIKSDEDRRSSVHELLRPYRQRLRRFGRSIQPDRRVVGTGGTLSTLAALNSTDRPVDFSRLHGRTLRASRIEELARALGALTAAELRQQIDFDPKRARVIVAGTYLAAGVLEPLCVSRMIHSSRGLRWGVAQMLAAGKTLDFEKLDAACLRLH